MLPALPRICGFLFSAFTLGILAGCGRTDSGATAPPQVDSASPASETAATGKRQPVRLALNWYPEAEHGGYIAANVHGFFDAENLDVEIIPGGPGAPDTILAELVAGRIDFAISDADNVVKARSLGAPVVAVMAPLQHSPRCIMVHEASGINSLEGLSGVELAIRESRPFALWMKKKLPLTGVTMVPYSGSVGEFLLKPKFAQQGFVFSEPFIAKEKGGDPKALMVSDIGFDPYASVLVTTEDTINTRATVVQSVVTASLKGWEQYLKDPVRTNADIHAKNAEMSLAALAYGAEHMAPLCQAGPGGSPCGMTLDRWKTLVAQIEEINDIETGSVDPSKCFTMRFAGP